jgi:hypothetical protein
MMPKSTSGGDYVALRAHADPPTVQQTQPDAVLTDPTDPAT